MDLATTISDPPAAALKLIFGSLSMQDLNQCALVSKRWRQQINTEIGFKVIVGENRHRPDFLNHPILLITQIGIQSCRIQKAEEVLPFKHPRLVKSIILDGTLLSRQWNLLLVPLINLSALTISQFALYGLRRKQLKLDFPNLQCLIISGKPPPTPIVYLSLNDWMAKMGKMKLKRKQMIENVIHVFKKAVTPRIKEIVLQKLQVKSAKQADLIVLYLCRFIVRNKATLKKLSIVIHLDTERESVNSRLDKSLDAELERLNIGLPGLHLHSMFVQISMIRSSRTQKMLRLILESQMHKQLEHIIWKFSVNTAIHGFPNELVTRNHDNLESIEMDFGPVQESINCHVFANCASLRYLKLIRGQVDGGNNGPDEPQPQLTQTQLLPSSLVSIQIAGLQIRTEDARCISLLNLDVLELLNIGDSNGFGLSFSAFQNIVFGSHNIKFLSLSKCLVKDEGFVGAGSATTFAFCEICHAVSGDQGYWPGGLYLQLFGQEYSPMLAQALNGDFGTYYDYGSDLRSTYFKNLRLQSPKAVADGWETWGGAMEVYLVRYRISDDIDDDDEDFEEHDFVVVGEDLSEVDVDGDPNPEEEIGDGGEEEDASDSG